jgi:hypothetical protein
MFCFETPRKGEVTASDFGLSEFGQSESRKFSLAIKERRPPRSAVVQASWPACGVAGSAGTHRLRKNSSIPFDTLVL